MKSNGINHNSLKLLIEAGSINFVTALAKGDQWTLRVAFGDSNKTVLAKNSGKARIWRKLDTLAKYLSDLGLKKFEIDMQAYDPEQKSLRRPDSALTLKRTHEAHKAQQIRKKEKDVTHTQSEDEADMSPEDVRVNWEERRAKILKQENPRVK